MLRPRIIPVLLIRNGGLIKTVGFKDGKYLGDPINAVKIFNEKEVDELVVLDIDATALNNEPNYEMISNLASECRMPLCYGGGVSTPEQVEKIISLGVEKVAISSAAIVNPALITEAAKRVGNQSIVVVVDVKKTGLLRKYEIFITNGKRKTGVSPFEFVPKLEALGAGEVVINSIEDDGSMKGFNITLAKNIRKETNLPLTILGGAGSLEDIHKVIKEFGIIGIAAGSLFVFKGKYRAVLINYPERELKNTLVTENNKCD